MSESFYDRDTAARQDRLASTPDMVDQRARIVAALQPRRAEDMLELGTGNGALLRDLQSRPGFSGRLVGLDTSRDMLAIARGLAPGAEFVLGSAEALPFADGSFDAVFAAQLLCFLPNPDRSLAEALRVLRPGGRVVLLDTDWATLVWHSREPDLMRQLIAAYTSHYADPHVPRTLGPRLAAAGFENIACESFVVLCRDLSEDSYAGQTFGFAVPIMRAHPGFTEAEIERLVADLEALDAVGASFFSLNRYLFRARKPR